MGNEALGPFDVAAVAARYSVSAATVREWITSGDLAAVNVSRSAASRKPRWRISASALEAFEARRAPTLSPLAPRRQRRKKPTDVVEFYR
jgi:hypothetical protein